MKTLTAIRAQIVTLATSALPDANIHNHERWAITPDAYKDIFVSGSKVHVVMVKLKTRQETTIVANLTCESVFDFAIKIYRSFQDSTTTAFEDSIETVVNAFRSNSTLSGTARTSGWRIPQIDFTQSPVFLGPVLCHQAILNYWTLIRQKRAT